MRTLAEVPPSSPSPTRRRNQMLGAAFGLLVIGLLSWAAGKVDWASVWTSVLALPPQSLLAAAAVTALGHFVYATYDLMGRAWTGGKLPTLKVLQVAFVSYAFTLNLGSLVGGVGFRFRLYSRLGMRKGPIGKVVGLSMLTNWLGYGLLAGCVFLTGGLVLPQDWTFSDAAMRTLGAGMLLTVAAYLILCAFVRRRHIRVRGHHLSLPSARLAVLQVVVSTANWMATGWVLWLLMPHNVPYPDVLTALLVAALAGVITHVPGGLGVLEAVFVAMLTPAIAHGPLLAALVAYRAIYYLLPLALAAVMYFVLEARAPQLASGAQDAHGHPARHRPPGR